MLPSTIKALGDAPILGFEDGYPDPEAGPSRYWDGLSGGGCAPSLVCCPRGSLFGDAPSCTLAEDCSSDPTFTVDDGSITHDAIEYSYDDGVNPFPVSYGTRHIFSASGTLEGPIGATFGLNGPAPKLSCGSWLARFEGDAPYCIRGTDSPRTTVVTVRTVQDWIWCEGPCYVIFAYLDGGETYILVDPTPTTVRSVHLSSPDEGLPPPPP